MKKVAKILGLIALAVGFNFIGRMFGDTFLAGWIFGSLFLGCYLLIID
jgi:hypothetical protein